jgi:xylan 1,4-beta-xylosidase
VVENFAPEGPKLLRRGAWFYLVTAIGGTAGPVTGHMVIAARSKSIHGPWEHCPHNPLVRTVSTAEPWWSRGMPRWSRACRGLVDGLSRL